VSDSRAESLVRKEPEVPTKDPIVSRSTSGLMLICALLLTGSLAWALYDEAFGQRPWKTIQREYVSRYRRFLDSIKPLAGKSEKEIKESPEYQALDEQARAAHDEVKAETAQIDAEVKQIQAKLDAVTDPFQNQRGRLTVINYNIEIADSRAKDRYRRQAENTKKEIVEVEMPADDNPARKQVQRMDYPTLEKTYNDLRDLKAQKLGRKAALLKTPSELDKKRDDYLKNHLFGLSPSQIETAKQGLNSFDYSILGHQVSVNEYNIVDRCEL